MSPKTKKLGPSPTWMKKVLKFWKKIVFVGISLRTPKRNSAYCDGMFPQEIKKHFFFTTLTKLSNQNYEKFSLPVQKRLFNWNYTQIFFPQIDPLEMYKEYLTSPQKRCRQKILEFIAQGLKEANFSNQMLLLIWLFRHVEFTF